MNVDVRAHRAAADAHAAAPDVDARRRFTDLQHLAQRRRRTHAASLALVALAAVVAVSLFATNRDGAGISTPMSPNPAVPWVPPTPTDWSALQGRGTSAVPGGTWDDPSDTSVEGVDLTRVQYGWRGRPDWSLGLAAWPQPGSSLHEGVVISYGVVVDSTHDGTADYVIGIARGGSQLSGSGAFRVWVTDLATNETDEKGPPYGFPFDFGHDSGKRSGTAGMSLFFLDPGPFDDAQHARWYAWSSLSRDGEVIAWDTAPDTGWIYNP